MEESFSRSRFSSHFNNLTYLGMWSPETLSDPRARKFYWIYRIFWWVFLLVAITVQMIDLYFVFGNLRKITYNFCTSVIVIGIAVKLTLLYGRRDSLNKTRLSLWRDSIKLNRPEDVAIQDAAYRQLKSMRNCFYIAASIVLPIWIVSSYFSYQWGPRQLAFAGYFGIKDFMDDASYVPALLYQFACGVYIIFLVIEADLAMFSVILQMEAYYQILIKDILQLNEIYGDENCEGNEIYKTGKVEVNAILMRANSEKLVKRVIRRQLEILQYAKSLEFIFSRCIILQVFAGSLLIVMNGLELSMYLHEMSVKLYFQSGYVILIIADFFFICYHLSRLSAESFNVGTAAYSTVWYKMDAEVRKSIIMIIIRSQKPPRITAGKLFLMDLKAYLHMMRNIYSWLMLFRQLGAK